jgi:20S proteasome alpha/beta subunit
MDRYLEHLDAEGYFAHAVPHGVKEMKDVRATTIVGLLFEDGVVLCADSQATDIGSLDRLREPMRKLFLVAQNAVLGVAGTVGFAQTIARIFEAAATHAECRFGRALKAEHLSLLLKSILTRFFSVTALEQGMIVYTLLGAVDDEGGHLYCADPLGTLLSFEETGHYAIGSGSVQALTYLAAVGHTEQFRSLSKEKAVAYGMNALAHAADVNVATGGPFFVAVIDRSGARVLASDEIEAMCSAVFGNDDAPQTGEEGEG